MQHNEKMSLSDTAMLAAIYQAADRFTDWRALALSQAATVHIAIMSEPFLSYVFDGRKTVESRFSMHKIAPYQKVRPGDIVLMKAGSIIGSFCAGWVQSFDAEVDDTGDIREEYGKAICGDNEFWRAKRHKRYITLIQIKDVTRLPPVAIPKYDRRAWISIRNRTTL